MDAGNALAPKAAVKPGQQQLQLCGLRYRSTYAEQDGPRFGKRLRALPRRPLRAKIGLGGCLGSAVGAR